VVIGTLLVLGAIAGWFMISLTEFATGRRIWPWSAYAFCGHSTPAELPKTVRIGLYEEFPNPWRLAKLSQLDFPVTLAIAAPSRAEFSRLRDEILATYPHVQEVVFWPILSQEEGYYPGPWSEPAGIQRIIDESDGLPLLWDLEVPRGTQVEKLSIEHWWQNRISLPDLFANHDQPVHVWRTHVSMGLDSLFLRMIAMRVDPSETPNARLHLDMYATGGGRDPKELNQIVRCGIERYGERFIPSLGVLNDGEGPPEVFVPMDTFQRNLRVVREAGASEVWFFGSNGLNPEYLDAIRTILPIEGRSAE
jgi:hypothetical protein